MSAYNAGDFLIPAIQSILTQTLRDFEFIIIDDASTDGTQETLRAYSAQDRRIRLLLNESNLGLTRSLNRGLAAVQAPWIARMDADDLSTPDRLARQLAVAEKNPGAGLINCWHDMIDRHGRRIGHARRGVGFRDELLPWFLLFYNRVGGHGQVMYRTDTVRAVGGYDETFTYAQDRELWLRLLRAGPAVTVPRVLYRWRESPQSITNAKRKTVGRYDPGSLLAGQREITRTCGIEIFSEEATALRDFWLRFHDGTQDWPAIQRRLLELARLYSPPRPMARKEARLRTSIAVGWLVNALRASNQKDPSLAAAHLRRACEAAKRDPWQVMTRFGYELASVRGRADQMI
jgi:glycosyltransferase involved in cell wall biosynthesis